MNSFKDFFSLKNIICMCISCALGLYLAFFIGSLFPTSIGVSRSSIKLFQCMVFIICFLSPLVILNSSIGGAGGKKSKKYGNQGTATEGTISELKSLKGKDGFVVSKNFRLSLDKSFEHLAIIGPTGSGKSSSFFIPNLLDLNGEVSVMVTDPKGEMHNKTSAYLESLGYTIIKLSPLEPQYTDRYYNPLLIANDANEIREIAQMILANGGKSIEMMSGSSSGGAEWVSMAVPLLTAALCYVREKGKEKTVEEALRLILTDSLEQLSAKMETVPAANRSFLLFKASAESEKTMSSIKTVLTNNAQIFTDENVIEFTKTPFVRNAYGEKTIDKTKIFNPKILRQKPTVVFVCVPEIKSTYAMPIMSVFYSQVLEKCMTNDGCPILFFLDEFANIGIIPSISNIVATARSRGIGISLGLQGVEQLIRNYGKENAMDILNNLKTKVVYSGLTGDSAEYISNLAGVTTVESTSYSTQQGDLFSSLGGGNRSKQGISRNLYMPDEIRRMDEDKVLIIAHDKNPVKDFKNSYFNQRKYTKKLR